MFFSYLFLVVCLVNILCGFHVSGCDQCTDEPVFTPSRLVVKHGDPTSASCSMCQHGCPNESPHLEKSIGHHTRNGSTVFWTVNRMTEWDISIMCYYEDLETQKQCCSTLPITVYKPPDTVSISVNHTGPMVEGHQYTLQCTVQNVAPVGNLTVTFYRGHTPLNQTGSNKTTKTPETETFTLEISPSKDDDGAQYWCEAKLQLGPEGPQDLPVTVSQNLIATVYYTPQAVNSCSNEISVTEGDTLHLNCSAVGNPSPSYNWSGPMHHISPFNNISILTIKSVHADSAGQYNCTVENKMGKVNVLFNVHIKANISYILVTAILFCVVIGAILLGAYTLYYKHHRMGEYNLKKIFRGHSKLIPMPPA